MNIAIILLRISINNKVYAYIYANTESRDYNKLVMGGGGKRTEEIPQRLTLRIFQ